jgi:hypothetical protein
MKQLKTFCIMLFIAFSTAVVSADIVDLPDENGKGYFKDTATGRTWMDVDTFLNMSYNEIAAEIATTDFHIANYDELLSLQSSIAPTSATEFDSFAAIIGGSETGFTRYVNEIPVQETIISGWWDDSDQSFDDPDKAGMSWIYNWQLTWHNTPNSYDKASSLSNTGAWVVTAAPEPISSVLFLLGGAGLITRRLFR